MRTMAGLLTVAPALCVCLAGVDLKEDPPPVAPPRAGDIRGSITPAEKVASVEAISRLHQKVYKPKSLDAGTGRFVFADLPGDADYDLRVQTTDGRTCEGIDLSWCESRMLRLARERRKQLGLPPERDQPFTADDANAVLKWVADWEDFLEDKRALYVAGHGRRATVLVELMRTREFYSAGGAFVWRVELWYLQDEFGAWDRVPNMERMLYRKRLSPAEWRKIDIQWLPELSVHVGPDGASKPVSFEIPDKTDASRGRPANSEPKIKTRTHILGLDEKAGKTGKTDVGG